MIKKYFISVVLIFLFIVSSAAYSNDFKIYLKSTNIKFLEKKGLGFYKKKNYKAALTFFNRILKLKPKNQNALYNCACMNALLGNVNRTIYYLLNLFIINPKWKVKLKYRMEKDFLKIFYNPLFAAYRKFWLTNLNFKNFVKRFSGSYESESKIALTSAQAVESEFEIVIGKDNVFDIGVPAYGSFLRGKIQKISNFSNIYVLSIKCGQVSFLIEMYKYRRRIKIKIRFHRFKNEKTYYMSPNKRLNEHQSFYIKHLNKRPYFNYPQR